MLYTLTRTGRAPLAFDGETLADASSKWTNGRENNRWHEVAVYRTVGGRYVVAVTYQTQWQGEQDYHWVVEASEPSEVSATLAEFGDQITEPVKGYPVGSAYAERQARLMSDLRQRYDSLVSEVLGADKAFCEVID